MAKKIAPMAVIAARLPDDVEAGATVKDALGEADGIDKVSQAPFPKSKQLNKGLQELGEEGAIQVFKPMMGSLMLLGAIGQLQFEVVAHRLKTEYGVEVRLGTANYAGARWVSCPDPAELNRFVHANGAKMFLRRRPSPDLPD